MQHLKESVQRLLQPLVGTWDFELDTEYRRSPYVDLLEPLLNRRYVIEDEYQTFDDIVLVGYDALDDTRLQISFSPTHGPGGSEYLFYMADYDKAELGNAYERYDYRFNRYGNRLVGSFAVWAVESRDPIDFDPDKNPVLMTGYFLATKGR